MYSVSIKDLDSEAIDSSSPFSQAASSIVTLEYTNYIGKLCSLLGSLAFLLPFNILHKTLVLQLLSVSSSDSAVILKQPK